MRTKQQYICRRARRQICCAEKASQSFTSADVKAVKPVFCRDMRALQRGFSCPLRGIHLLAENTLRGASVELSAISGQLRRRAQRILFEKAALPLRRPWLSLFSSVLPRGTGKSKKAVSFHRFCFTIGKSCAIIIQPAYRAHSRT